MTENQALLSAKQVRPGVKIELDGKVFELVFNVLAFQKLETVANINAWKGNVDLMSPTQLLWFMWAGLITNHPEFEGDLIDGRPDAKLSEALRTIGEMLTMDKMEQIGRIIREAFSISTKGPSNEKAGSSGKKK